MLKENITKTDLRNYYVTNESTTTFEHSTKLNIADKPKTNWTYNTADENNLRGTKKLEIS